MTLTKDLYRTVVLHRWSVRKFPGRAWALYTSESLINKVIKQYICFHNLYEARGA